MLNRICVITIKVSDLERALRFYTEVLDFKISKRYGETIVTLEQNSVPLVIEEIKDQQVAGSGVLFAIRTEDLDGDVTALRAKGVNFQFEKSEACPPGKYNVMEDPFGNQIELLEFVS
jgi:lactoylglutathione lyase